MKKLTKLTVAAALMLSLAACDKADKAQPKAEAPAQTQQQAAPAEKAPADAPKADQNGDRPAPPQAEQPKGDVPPPPPAGDKKGELPPPPAAEQKGELPPPPPAGEHKPAPVENVKLTGKYAEALEAYPAVDPKLVEPIVISDKKSETGEADLKKLLDYIAASEQKIQPATVELQQKLHAAAQQKETELSEDVKSSLNAYAEKVADFQKGLEGLNLKDAEVKHVAEQATLAAKTSADVLIASVKNANLLQGTDGKSAEEPAFINAYMAKSENLKRALMDNQRHLADAVQKLAQKYAAK